MNSIRFILKTGQNVCYDSNGKPINCSGTGQDGEFQLGLWKKENRFKKINSDVALDSLTGLYWTIDANIHTYPIKWQDALSFIKGLNSEKFGGLSDWRLPNRKELRSLLFLQAKNPPLPPSHPFKNIFHGWYWTSTTASINPKYSWYCHMGGARMFYGRKDQEFLLWPVAGKSPILPQTGQYKCYDENGFEIPCKDTGQDGEIRAGVKWPNPRFSLKNELVVKDELTGLLWTRNADLSKGLVTLNEAYELILDLNKRNYGQISSWRLPNINELESLVDASTHSPSLPNGHPFENVREYYWSSTTSFYDPIWSWALYLFKGATGVGMKSERHFYCWAVSGN